MKRFFSKPFAGWEEPVSCFLGLRDDSCAMFVSGNGQERYSFIPLFPESFLLQTLESKGLQDVQEIWKREVAKCDLSSIEDWDIPYTGGVNGVIAYEYASFFEPHLFQKKLTETTLGVWFWSDVFLVFDHLEKKILFAGWSYFEEQFLEQFVGVQEKIRDLRYYPKKIIDPCFTPSLSKGEYLRSFHSCQKEIEVGNSFQINLSQGFSGSIKNDPLDIFAVALEKNPAPMMCFFEWKEEERKKSVISCSPERLFSLDKNGVLKTQPIAGTRPRGKTLLEEKQFENELHTSLKEQSEHAMLVDLHRNDFGKVCQYGSVRVEDFARIEKYATVMHLVSDILGVLDPEKKVFDALQACFPGGSITGAPKHETMKILEHIEESSRGFYCGSAGYIGVDGAADFNILIRTLECENGKITGRAGGGIVFGADGESEYEETLSKWRGVEKIF